MRRKNVMAKRERQKAQRREAGKDVVRKNLKNVNIIRETDSQKELMIVEA